MPDPPSNPFASPEIEEVPAYTGPLHQSKTMGRWVGLSTLSGILLFAAYFVASMTLCILLTLVVFFPERISPQVLTPLGIYCAVAGIYGILIGFVLGITFGMISYWAPAGRGIYTLYVFGLPLGVLLTVFAPLVILYDYYAHNALPAQELTLLLIWTACLGLFSLIASAHLVVNIRRFLVKPLESPTG
ncbi:hypothetical protein DTL42_10060 [Bremerella cremea]|uniref:Uncharacterized protein n=1 Tax=Bremerella cremea TaxID=1031537 RepID=A0A368KW31_9BACT|nr:hypothetical protein [Bremerella cremea]RCS51894.1 hypothetical protein DTL42_10060 [Bremerella cremea]